MTRNWATVIVTIATWLVLSNHCALGLNGSSRALAAESGGCPMHSVPAKKKPATNLPCCKDLRAVVAKCVQVTGLGERPHGSQDYAPEIFLRSSCEAVEIDGFDTGPPGRVSFAELVLQESLLAHAPPVS